MSTANEFWGSFWTGVFKLSISLHSSLHNIVKQYDLPDLILKNANKMLKNTVDLGDREILFWEANESIE